MEKQDIYDKINSLNEENRTKYEYYLNEHLYNKRWCKHYAEGGSTPNLEKARIRAYEELFEIPKKLKSLSKEKREKFDKYLEGKLEDESWLEELGFGIFYVDVDYSAAEEKAYKELFG